MGRDPACWRRWSGRPISARTWRAGGSVPGPRADQVHQEQAGRWSDRGVAAGRSAPGGPCPGDRGGITSRPRARRRPRSTPARWPGAPPRRRARGLGACPSNRREGLAAAITVLTGFGRSDGILVAMPKSFRPYIPEQSLLLPPSLSDWVPEGHLARFVSDVVDDLDLSAIEDAYEEERGYPPYDPRMMTKLLLYGYATGTYSSRRIAGKLTDSVAFRFLAAGNAPDFRTINGFARPWQGAGRAVYAGAASMPSGGPGEAGQGGGGRHEDQGECLEAQGDELRADDGEARALKSEVRRIRGRSGSDRRGRG